MCVVQVNLKNVFVVRVGHPKGTGTFLSLHHSSFAILSRADVY